MIGWRSEMVGGAMTVSLSAAGAAGIVFNMADANIMASLAGGLCGALITAREAFDEASPDPVWKIAVASATSLFIGACMGLFLAPLMLALFNAGITQKPETVVAFAFLTALGGERVVGPILKKIFGDGVGKGTGQ